MRCGIKWTGCQSTLPHYTRGGSTFSRASNSIFGHLQLFFWRWMNTAQYETRDSAFSSNYG